MTYFAYLDEFGHIGPYLDRQHPRYNDAPCAVLPDWPFR